MKILAIETSCDETAVSVLDGRGELGRVQIEVLGDALLSQAETHAAFGGVYPALAKREHELNLVPLATEALSKAGMLASRIDAYHADEDTVSTVRGADFKASVSTFVETYDRPDIELIAVTKGPGLEPALWTGITFAESLGKAWNIPVIGVDHMEGHMVSALLRSSPDGSKELHMYSLNTSELPLLSLLISGGHTELILMRRWFEFERVGATKDDAVGEAFDKVARLLDLSYPGGPKIALLAEKARVRGGNTIVFPRPMANDATCDFSFSGLKTAVLYKLRAMDEISETDKEHIAEAFEDAARDVIVIKTRKALRETNPLTLAVGGGVSANAEIRKNISEMVHREFPHVSLQFPDPALTGDNAIMIGAAAYMRKVTGAPLDEEMVANGNLKIHLKR